MKKIFTFLFIVLIILKLNGQDTTKLVIKAPKVFDTGGTLTLQFGSFMQAASVDSKGQATFKIPIFESAGQVNLAYMSANYQPLKWENKLSFNGSGMASLQLSEHGIVSFSQWPTVEFNSLGGPMDIYINGRPLGTTSFKKGIEPDKEHNLVWKKNGRDICSKKVKLPPNVSRKYTCNNGNISED